MEPELQDSLQMKPRKQIEKPDLRSIDVTLTLVLSSSIIHHQNLSYGRIRESQRAAVSLSKQLQLAGKEAMDQCLLRARIQRVQPSRISRYFASSLALATHSLAAAAPSWLVFFQKRMDVCCLAGRKHDRQLVLNMMQSCIAGPRCTSCQVCEIR